MSSIYNIITDPQKWVAFDSGKCLKEEFGGEPLMTVRYGVLDDDYDIGASLETYMRKVYMTS